MPDVSSIAPAMVRMWVALGCPQALDRGRRRCRASGGAPEVRADREHRARDPPASSAGSAGPRAWRSATRPGPCGYELYGCSSELGVACDIDRAVAGARSAPATGSRPIAATPRSWCVLYRAGELMFVAAADARAGRPARPGALPRRSALRADRGAPPGRQAAAALRARSSARARSPGRSAPPRLGAPPAARRPARAARARAHARPSRQPRRAARRARRPARADRRAATPWSDPVRWLCSLPRHLDADRARAAGRDRRLPRFGHRARADELPRPDRQRVLLRRPAPPRPHHQDRQPPRPPAADRGRLALPPPPRAAPRTARPHVPPDVAARAWQRPGPPAPPPPPPHRRTASAPPSPPSPSPASSPASSGPR